MRRVLFAGLRAAARPAAAAASLQAATAAALVPRAAALTRTAATAAAAPAGGRAVTAAAAAVAAAAARPMAAASRASAVAEYPSDVPPSLDYSAYPSLTALLDRSLTKFAARPAFKFLGSTVSYAEVDEQSRALAAYLQGLGLGRGDRVAIMLPNLPQYPVAAAAVLRAGLVIVNVNPLYTPRELAHLLADSGAKAIVILENFAGTLQQVVEAPPLAERRKLHVVLASLGDSLGLVKGAAVNIVTRHVRRLVPHFSLPGAVRFNSAVAEGAALQSFVAPTLGPDDLAVLQYTGGTTGASKGAMLLHRNLVANVMQCGTWYTPAVKDLPPDEGMTIVCALPLYHIFSFTTNMLVGIHIGARNILIPNPRDIAALLRALVGETIHSLPAVNTLFGAIQNHPDFAKVDWRNLKLSVAGGMAVQQGTAKQWLKQTGCAISEGYGLSEASPVVTAQPVDRPPWSGSTGLPLPDTEIAILQDDGSEAGIDEPGEIAVRGPQVFAGYWGQPEESARAFTADGFLLTGDIGAVNARGYFRIVDRKKDMIIVSGFKVFPNEVEDVVSTLPGVLECAAFGVPDERSGEAVKLVVVRKADAGTLDEQAVRVHCKKNLAGYKCPAFVEFRETLPKSPVGKVLRRLLRDPATP
jgi:long-chain acyl-CoA synthetase